MTQSATEWKETTLGEVIDIFDHKRVPLNSRQRAERRGPYPYYGASGIIDWVDSYLFDGRYLLVAEDGENLNSRKLPVAFFASGKFWVNNHAHIIRGKPGVADDYFLMSHFATSSISGYITGAAQPKLSQANLKRIGLRLPPLAVQRKIAAILSAYDDLIENNRRRIEILEEMARRIYREWFVEFRFPGHENVRLVDSELGKIPEGWEAVRVKDAIEFNPRIRIPDEGEKPYVAMNGLSDNSMLVNITDFRTRVSGAKFQNGDTLFARITPCLENGKTGFVQFLPARDAAGFGSTEFIVLRSLTLCPEFVYLLARDENFRGTAIKSMSGASGRQRVDVACFDEYLIPSPPRDVLGSFRAIVSPMFRSIHLLSLKCTNLSRTRDLLLPRLISGELDVSELPIDPGADDADGR